MAASTSSSIRAHSVTTLRDGPGIGDDALAILDFEFELLAFGFERFFFFGELAMLRRQPVSDRSRAASLFDFAVLL